MAQNTFVASQKHTDMMLNSKSIGNKIVVARKNMNLSQAELANQVAISPQAVGKWERGESMPDITMLNRLAEILKVDLNYFGSKPLEKEMAEPEPFKRQVENHTNHNRQKADWNWDMSQGNWSDADFSGLKNLKEKFSSSNMKNCKFMDADLSGLILGKNNIEQCDFTGSEIRDSKIQSSNLSNNAFLRCSFIDAEFFKSNIERCNFSQADFSGAELIETNFERNIVAEAEWKFTKFLKSNLSNIVFAGTLEDCHFEHCGFHNVKFENATILNTFFKNNMKFKKVQFVDCKVDSITYAFLKNNQAEMSGITLIV